MSWGPGGWAALRSEAAAGLGQQMGEDRPEDHLDPRRILPIALAAVAVCALSGLGVLPWAAGVVLDLGGALCYFLALRAALPHWPELPGRWLRPLSGMGVAALPLVGFAAACVALLEQPGLPGVVVLPLWVLLLLTVCPWLELGAEQGFTASRATTLFALLTVSVPLPFFTLAMSPSVSAPTRAVVVAAAVLTPTWRLVSLAGPSWSRAWRRSLLVAVVLGAAAGASALLRVPIELLPVALLLGWYGLAGVVGRRRGTPMAAFAVFVVVAGVMLALAGPV